MVFSKFFTFFKIFFLKGLQEITTICYYEQNSTDKGTGRQFVPILADFSKEDYLMKKMSVKSALVALIILLVSFTAFAVDFSASTYITGSLWGTNGLSIDNTNQKDSDLLTITVSDEMWGSSFRLYTSLADDSVVNARKIAIWVKPLPSLKLTVGSITSGLYTEQLDWWQVPNAAAFGSASYEGDTATSGSGAIVELTPVDGLWILAGISPGIGNTLMANNAGTLEAGANTDFGVAAKYSISGFGSVGGAYHFKGAGEDMNFRVGLDINAVSGLYAFLQAICRMDDAAAPALDGVTIDEYIAYTAGDLSIKATAPVTIRLTDAADATYMTYDLKIGYTVMENVTPYVRVEDSSAVSFNNFQFTPTIQVGADYSLGKVTFMTAVQIDVPATGDITWSIPFKMRASW